jgi:hypothetical protein
VPFAERWHGSSWTFQRAANPGGTNGSAFAAVSCAKPNACTAVGYYNVGSIGAFASLAERWNGHSWKTQRTPNPPGGTFLNWVSCPGVDSCVAVGNYYDQFGTLLPLAEHWDGKRWKIRQVPVPTGGSNTNLLTLSCSAANACTVAGYYLDGSGTWLPLAERWDGTSWTIESTPSPPGATLTYLYSVSCDAVDSCTAGGFYRNAAAVDVTLAMHWDGASWTIERSRTPAGATDAYIGDISCTAGALCTAVGSYDDRAGTSLTLSELRR